MDTVRSPFQGVSNILRFNWHYYAFASAAALAAAAVSASASETMRVVGVIGVVAVAGTTAASLCASCYVYDLSGFYRLEWLNDVPVNLSGTMLNIHAGFDETSALLRERYHDATWTVMDFFDPAKHTEVSIERARRAYPPSPLDVRVESTKLPSASGTIDAVFVLLAAHEIRSETERALFFAELHRVLKPRGIVVVAEHLRDAPNFFAYTVGGFHFVSRAAWLVAFEQARLDVIDRLRPNVFISCFVLQK